MGVNDMKTKEKNYLKYMIKIREYYTETKLKKGFTVNTDRFWVAEIDDRAQKISKNIKSKKDFIKFIREGVSLR